jgi:Homing endonuclease associated repeat
MGDALRRLSAVDLLGEPLQNAVSAQEVVRLAGGYAAAAGLVPYGWPSAAARLRELAEETPDDAAALRVAAARLEAEAGESAADAAAQMLFIYTPRDLVDPLERRRRRSRKGTGYRGARRNWTEEKIIEALRAEAEWLGRTPRADDWRKAAPEHPVFNTVLQRFGSWPAALLAAGLADGGQGEPPTGEM